MNWVCDERLSVFIFDKLMHMDIWPDSTKLVLYRSLNLNIIFENSVNLIKSKEYDNKTLKIFSLTFW